MSRTRATALALVNWKGVFYERYQIDRHVTALEGANGAGKTTVMIAAYVVMLPDLSRLRFTNLGESGATGGDRGIHGRLGEAGRPSYSVLELALASGERILAGVRLERGSETSVEATPFLITGLAEDVRIQDILLVRQGEADLVPELAEIKEAVRRRGGAVEVFRSVKDYLAALFERGVTPLRLASEEDRSKLNEMLRTSMTGGISRALTTELRGFLLKEETGLGDTLSRMRANLDACRRTRIEVGEARHLEREITGVFEAGHAMFAAAVAAAHEVAAEARVRADDAGAARLAAEHTLADLTAHDETRGARQEALESRVAAAQAEVERATAARARRAAARGAAARLADLADEVAVRTALVDSTRAGQVATAAERSAGKEARARAAAAYDQAAHGLAHLQAGLDELHRRAHAHRTYVRRLAEATTFLGRPVSPDDAAAAIGALVTDQESLDAERARLERLVRDAGTRAADHARALAALVQLEAALDPSPSSSATPHDRARAALATLATRESLAARLADLGADVVAAEMMAVRQQTARTRAAALGLNVGVAGAAVELHARLESAEQALRDAEEEARAAELARSSAVGRSGALAKQRRELSARAARWTVAAERVARLGLALRPGSAGPSRADLLELRDALGEELRVITARRAQLAEQRDTLLRRAGTLATSGELDPELLRLRDDLGAELLASRFEDVELDEAAAIEARLGPLADALIVEDLDGALAALAASPRELVTVHLVRADLAVELGPASSPDVVVHEPWGARITRRAETPRLGRRARERHAAALRVAADTLGSGLETLAEHAHRLTARRRETDALLDELDGFAAGDPGADLAHVDAELTALAAVEPSERDRANAARRRATVLTDQIAALRRLLGEGLLLEPPDHSALATALAADLEAAREVRGLLAQLAAPRRALAELIDELRVAPPTDEERAAATTRRAAVEDALDRGARARAALEDVLAQRAAAGWTDAEAALAASVSLAPALEAQHAAAREAVHASDAVLAAAEADWESATAAWQDAEARRAAAAAHHERAATELSGLGDALDGPDDATVARQLADAMRARAALDVETRVLVENAALGRERRQRATAELAAARAREDDATVALAPATAAWDLFAAGARAAGLLAAALAPHEARQSAAVHAAAASSKRALLLDRLAVARGGAALAAELRDARGEPAALAAWLAVRDWLRQRVPAQVAEVADPLEALERLRDHLDVLEGRLTRQERDLRGASEDVARGIEVQLRRARGQVRRLNQQLDGVHFGSVAGVRVEMRRIDRMEQILRALRDGEAQELLFLASMPIEEALDEIFRRHGGGRGGGLRLLDYREYLDLVVEVRRRGTETWEPTSPTRLSTGEAIGVGAALMMVVLTEWERDSQLLHGRRTGGSLRFLFLDEANRLSRDNLGILFELCRNLDLQLLVAAPEVARAEGNTTYRLIRQVTDDGREEVIVSGRRAITSESAA